LRPCGINHPEYNVLMMLYGTEGYALNASELAEADGEKAANITG
jgi:MarR family transcriptional repressor of emrRAB